MENIHCQLVIVVVTVAAVLDALNSPFPSQWQHYRICEDPVHTTVISSPACHAVDLASEPKILME